MAEERSCLRPAILSEADTQSQRPNTKLYRKQIHKCRLLNQEATLRQIIGVGVVSECKCLHVNCKCINRMHFTICDEMIIMITMQIRLSNYADAFQILET